MSAIAFRNACLCEDVRDEIGNKKSLMGVFSGDVVVTSFPAQFRVAFYAEYLPQRDAGEHDLDFVLRLGESATAKGTLRVAAGGKEVANIIIPQGIAIYKEPGEIIWEAGLQGGEMVELLRKQVRLADDGEAFA